MAWFDADTRIIITAISENPGTVSLELYKDENGKWWAGFICFEADDKYNVKYSGRSPEMACNALAEYLRKH